MIGTERRQELIRKRGNKCECCGLTKWLGSPIKLEIHHLDGNRKNDNEDNLQILCPNCHSYTDNHSKNLFKHTITDEELIELLKQSPNIHQALINANLSTAGANYDRARRLVIENNIEHLYIDGNQQYIKTELVNHCIDCGKIIDGRSTRCKECANKNQQIANWPAREEFKQLIRTTSFAEIGRQFGVSGAAVAKWAKRCDLPYRKKDIIKFTDEEWAKL